MNEYEPTPKPISEMDLIQAEIHATAVSKGWWEKERNIPECLMLIVSEISEALEEYRDGRVLLWHKGDKPEGMYVELADAVIRIMDLCEHGHVSLADMIEIKTKYNNTRPYRHGGKAA
jgi:hypothetical protein